MIKHIVMWKFKDFAEGNDRKTNIKIAEKMLLDLKYEIDAINYLEMGVNVNENSAAYDLVLYSEFKDMKALEEYQNHPGHLKVADFIGKVREARAVVDYEI